MQKRTLANGNLEVSAIGLGYTAGQQPDAEENGDGPH
jgi:aryl-alcohol dehydrogenase-like predicted oxidoreductase